MNLTHSPFRLPKMPTADFTTAAEEVKALTKGCLYIKLIIEN